MKQAVTIERRIAAPPRLVWAFAADSNRWDRVIGAPPSTYTYERVDGGHERVGHARLVWGESAWVERGEWIEGRYFRGERHFRDGLARVAGLEVELTPVDGHTALRATSFVTARSSFPDRLAHALQENARQRLTDYFDAVSRVLADLPDDLAPDEPAAAVARRLVLRSRNDALLGPRSEGGAADLEFRRRRLAEAPIARDLRHLLVDLVEERSDDDLRQIRPFELARAWDLDRREVLTGFLHAARAGLFDLHWQALCPTCRVPAQVYGALAEARPHGFCAECDRDFAIELAVNLEAVFQVNPAIRKVSSGVWCAGSPWFRPHVFALLEVAPGAARELPEVPVGAVRIRTTDEHVLDMPHLALSEIDVGPDGIRPAEGARAEAAGPVRFVNVGEQPVVVLIERRDWQPEVVLGRDLLLLPDFHGLFGMEAPATGVDLSVGNVTVLFSDLTDSTALYRRLGDGRAFALIQAHFAVLGRIVARYDGAVIKTMGDAIMATFLNPRAGLEAAIDMVRETAALHPEHGLALKVGLHEGPCLVVRANDRLDLFGTTVNLAARLQAAAEPHQIVVHEDWLQHRDVSRLVRRERLDGNRRRIVPKGLGQLTCVALQVALGAMPSAHDERRD